MCLCLGGEHHVGRADLAARCVLKDYGRIVSSTGSPRLEFLSIRVEVGQRSVLMKFAGKTHVVGGGSSDIGE